MVNMTVRLAYSILLYRKMRGKDVDIAATNLLPAETFYAVFDGVDVTSYVERSNEIEVTSTNAALFRIGDHITSSGGGKAALRVLALTLRRLRYITHCGCHGSFLHHQPFEDYEFW